MAEALDAILPKGAVGVERGAIGETAALAPSPDLYPVEEHLIAGASERRRREFAEARACAREALRRLGVAAGPIPATPDGAPVWPEGVVGSITHKGGYRAAVVAFASDIAGIGIDAEPDERLPDGVLETIASPAELDRVEALLERRPGVAWDRLLFCAKEAAVKAAYPLGLAVAGARSVEATIDPDARAFSARVQQAEDRVIAGTWDRSAGLLVAVARWSDPSRARKLTDSIGAPGFEPGDLSDPNRVRLPDCATPRGPKDSTSSSAGSNRSRPAGALGGRYRRQHRSGRRTRDLQMRPVS